MSTGSGASKYFTQGTHRDPKDLCCEDHIVDGQPKIGCEQCKQTIIRLIHGE